MILLLLLPVLFLDSCAGFQGVADDVEKIETESAVRIEITKEAMQKDTDVSVTIEVKNKDTPAK